MERRIISERNKCVVCRCNVCYNNMRILEKFIEVYSVGRRGEYYAK